MDCKVEALVSSSSSSPSLIYIRVLHLYSLISRLACNAFNPEDILYACMHKHNIFEFLTLFANHHPLN